MKEKSSYLLVIIALIFIIQPSIQNTRDVKESKYIVQQLEDKIQTELDETIDLEGYNGILEIEAIDLKLPIKHGAIHENMTTSVATITNEKLEKGKNYSIAGHRNIRYGKNFNRLNELEPGDVVKIHNTSGTHEFILTEKDIILPTDTQVLADKGKTEVTLVTCHPMSISTHRLILKGEMINEKIN